MKVIYSRAEVIDRLGGQVFRDALNAGWLKPRAIKPGKTKIRPHAKVIFALTDIEKVERRILDGEYPVPKAAEPEAV